MSNTTVNRQKILVAMSGGVDSSVAAGLLKESGAEVIGVSLRLLPAKAADAACCGAPEELLLARACADKLGIPHYVLDYSEAFEKDVIGYFSDAYLAGETPNPCLACNRHIKFDKLAAFARSLKADGLATGHYARILPVGDAFRLLEAVDGGKDQSYVLYTLTQEQLAFLRFPLGGMMKTEVRARAAAWGLPTSQKKDSQDICFIPGQDYHAFLRERMGDRQDAWPLQPGPIQDHTGAVIGEHKGVAFYTIGQRSGLGVSRGAPLYVTGMDATTNTLTVGPAGADAVAALTARDAVWTAGQTPEAPFDALVRVRYRHTPVLSNVTPEGDGFRARFLTPQRGVSPGQAAVLYRDTSEGREVIGGGTIRATTGGAP